MKPLAPVNVLGEALEPCSTAPLTGFFRDGHCNTCAEDSGSHTVCAIMTAEFLAYSKYVGNDLSTPRPEFRFAGLKPGDRWCVCALRWREAYEAARASEYRHLMTYFDGGTFVRTAPGVDLVLLLDIDEVGQVTRATIDVSSGDPALDEAARTEVLELFPELAADATGFPAARLSLKAHEAKVLVSG